MNKKKSKTKTHNINDDKKNQLTPFRVQTEYLSHMAQGLTKKLNKSTFTDPTRT